MSSPKGAPEGWQERLPPRVRRVLPGAAVALALGLMFGPMLAFRARMMANPMVLTGDTRQHLVPFFRYYEAGTFRSDFLGDYFLSVMTVGFRGLYTALSTAMNPTTLGKAVSLLLLILLLGGLAVAAKRLAGYWGVLGTLALALSCPLYLDRTAGGMARGFGYPILAFAAWALVSGRIKLLAAVVVAGAAFYPIAVVPAGIALAIVLFFYPAKDRGEAATWPIRRRVAVVVCTAALAALVVLPSMITGRPNGPGLAPADAASYPEAGPGGRYEPNDRAPFGSFTAGALTQARRALKGDGKPLVGTVRAWMKTKPPFPGISREDAAVEVFLGALALGTFLLVRRDVGTRRLLALATGSWVAFLLACAVAPLLYLPFRYISFPVPLLVMLLLPAAGAALAAAAARVLGLSDRRGFAKPIGACVLSVLCLVTLGGRGDAYAGLLDAGRGENLYREVARLQKDALIAGWPDDLMDSVPYFSRRRALLQYECHQAFHQRHTEELRRRMTALTAAYFASNMAPITHLRDDFGVTHMVINRRHFQQFPTYFKPFDADVERAAREGAASGFALAHLPPEATVFEDGDLSLIDLHRLPVATGGSK